MSGLFLCKKIKADRVNGYLKIEELVDFMRIQSDK